MLRMYDVRGKLLSIIKSMYIDSSAYVRVKGGEREWLKIDNGVRYIYIYAEMKEVKMEMGRRGVRFLEDGREWRLPGLLYADDLVL